MLKMSKVRRVLIQDRDENFKFMITNPKLYTILKILLKLQLSWGVCPTKKKTFCNVYWSFNQSSEIKFFSFWWGRYFHKIVATLSITCESIDLFFSHLNFLFCIEKPETTVDVPQWTSLQNAHLRNGIVHRLYSWKGK